MKRLLTEILDGYFEDSPEPKSFEEILPRYPHGPGTATTLPVVPRAETWRVERDPERLVRTYEFTDNTTYRRFVTELMAHEEEVQHHGRLTLAYPEVRVEVWTHDVNAVTGLDRDWARAADAIYEDVGHWGDPEAPEWGEAPW